MKNLAIVPARSGSKGLKDKNILPLDNRPLLWHSVKAAIDSECFDEVMVSTDSEQYAKIALECGAKVPFLRSEEMSSDTASSWDAVKEVLRMYRELGEVFDTVCLLQPTSPLRTSQDIVDAYKLYDEKASVAVVSVCETEHSPKWCNTLSEDCSLDGFINSIACRRQDLQTYYRLNGAIYIVDTKELFESTNFYRDGSYAYVMPQIRSVDIDTILDFKYAELLMGYEKKRG